MSGPRVETAPRIDLLPVHLVLEMHLKVGGRAVGPGRVQLAGAVAAPDAREEGVGRVWGKGLARLDEDRLVRLRIDGAVAHEGLEGVVGVLGLEVFEGVGEPLRRWGLEFHVRFDSKWEMGLGTYR